jgi:acetyl-CoA carboxylase biotin carboxyl carrier protein
MDLQKIKALIDLLAESPLAKLEVIEGDERVKLVKAKRRRPHGATQQRDENPLTPVSSDTQTAAQASDEAAHALEASRANATTQDAPAATPQIVRAPMFGIVHLTPSPGEAPFVQVGDAVEEGQVLCTIEAMKMFNAIECEYRGTVQQILVAPGSEVESGQPLFHIG